MKYDGIVMKLLGAGAMELYIRYWVLGIGYWVLGAVNIPTTQLRGFGRMITTA